MSRPLKILYVEDNKTDAELVVRELVRAGFQPNYRIVMTEAEFLAELENMPDLILSDYALPQFDGTRALKLLNERKFEIPFILISGTLGEEAAVTSIKHGAADYLMKDRLFRLGSAVDRALEEHKLRAERRLADAALKQSEACLRIVSNFARIGFAVVDSDYHFDFANAAFADMFNHSSTVVAGRHFSHVFPTGDDKYVWSRLEKAFAGERAEYELKFTTNDKHVQYLVNYEPVLEENRVSSVVVVVMDITSRRITEEQLRQSQKMEAIGQLAGGIAHDFNNLLTVISTYASLLLFSTSLSEDAREFVNEISSASERAADLTRRLLGFSRRQMRSPEAVDLNDMIGETLKLLDRTLAGTVEISLHLDQTLKPIWIDRGELSQILMNLSINARDAMPDGGRLIIQTQCIEFPEGESSTSPSLAPGNYVLLSVSDSGHGMTEDVKQKIFEPFFTTKPTGKGTGLGLAIVHGIVARAGGGIHVSSGIGSGATFSIYFPQSPEVAEELGASSEKQRTLRGRESILLVEDDVMVRQAIRNILTDYGYTVIEAENGKQAVQVILDQTRSVDLLITDHVMPEMSGAALVEIATSLRPGTPILVVSGYIAESESRSFLANKNVAFLQKPFQPHMLASRIRDLLDLGSS